MADPPGDLVTDLTSRLERLQQEKDALEQAVQGQGDALALKLRLALLAYEQQRPPERTHRHRHTKSRSSSASSSLSTSASTSSSASFPTSPSTTFSPTQSLSASAEVSGDVASALRENETLRVRLANSERVNAYYQRELAELRRRCGISIDELEELDLSGNEGVVGTSAGANASSRRRQPSSSRSSRGEWASPPITGSIRIPGAASVSPPAVRLPSSSFSYSTNARLQPQSYTSYASSVGTNITTPSSSYPAARAPAPTPATANAFSPASRGSTHARRNSLSSLVAAAFANTQPREAFEEEEPGGDGGAQAETSAAGAAGLAPDPGASISRGIDLEDLLHLTPTAGAFPASATASTSAQASSQPPASAASSLSSRPAADPLVVAITRSLAKLAAAAEAGQSPRRVRLFEGEGEEEEEGKEPAAPEEEEEDDGNESGSSSTTSREGQGALLAMSSLRAFPRPLASGAGPIAGGSSDGSDGGETPLSISPGSRSGSLSRRVSARGRGARR
ncbi:hypothetical protein JCM10207_001377 [Rhodosporidiobolus poonsookiae]